MQVEKEEKQKQEDEKEKKRLADLKAERQRKLDEEEARKKMRKMWAQRMRCHLSLAVHRQETIIRSYYKSEGNKIGSVIRGNLVSMEHMKRGTSAVETWSHGKEPGAAAMERKKSTA